MGNLTDLQSHTPYSLSSLRGSNSDEKKNKVETYIENYTHSTKVKRRLSHSPKCRNMARGDRKPVTDMSKDSCRNFSFELEEAFPKSQKLFPMLTLTYGANFPRDVSISKGHLAELCRWIRDKHIPIRGFWRMGFQKRGAVHYHIMILGNISDDVLEKLEIKWRKIIKDDSVFVDVSKSKLGYMTKPENLDCIEIIEMINIGRFWGRIGISKAKPSDKLSGEKAERVARDTRKYREKSINFSLRKVDNGKKSYTLKDTAHIVRQLIKGYGEDSPNIFG